MEVNPISIEGSTLPLGITWSRNGSLVAASTATEMSPTSVRVDLGRRSRTYASRPATRCGVPSVAAAYVGARCTRSGERLAERPGDVGAGEADGRHRAGVPPPRGRRVHDDELLL